MKKKKIIIYHPYSYIGGADNSLKRLIENLDKNRFSVTFISLNQSILKNQLKNVEFINLDTKKALFSLFRLRTIVKKIVNLKKFEKVIVLSNQNFANIIAFFSLLGIKNIKKIFVDRNHLDELKFSSTIFKKIKNTVIKILIRITYVYADMVIGISKKLSRDLSNFCKIKVKTIYSPAYDLSIIKKASKFIRVNKKFKYIVNVSRFTKRKDIYTTLNGFNLVASKIKNLKLILVGYGNEYKNIKNYIDKLNLKNKVIIIYNCKNPYPYIKKSDLLILSSHYEGMGNVLVEAIILKTPVISSNCNSGPSEILLNGKGGDLFKVSDYKDLSNKILRHFKNKKHLLKKLKFAQKKLYRFDIKRHAKIYSKVFNEI